jgi:hypothetical protein
MNQPELRVQRDTKEVLTELVGAAEKDLIHDRLERVQEKSVVS